MGKGRAFVALVFRIERGRLASPLLAFAFAFSSETGRKRKPLKEPKEFQ